MQICHHLKRNNSQFTSLVIQNTNQACHGQKPEGCPFFKSNYHVSIRQGHELFSFFILMTLEKAERVVKGGRG